jgi:hypothetical protein
MNKLQLQRRCQLKESLRAQNRTCAKIRLYFCKAMRCSASQKSLGNVRGMVCNLHAVVLGVPLQLNV